MKTQKITKQELMEEAGWDFTIMQGHVDTDQKEILTHGVLLDEEPETELQTMQEDETMLLPTSLQVNEPKRKRKPTANKAEDSEMLLPSGITLEG